MSLAQTLYDAHLTIAGQHDHLARHDRQRVRPRRRSPSAGGGPCGAGPSAHRQRAARSRCSSPPPSRPTRSAASGRRAGRSSSSSSASGAGGSGTAAGGGGRTAAIAVRASPPGASGRYLVASRPRSATVRVQLLGRRTRAVLGPLAGRLHLRRHVVAMYAQARGWSSSGSPGCRRPGRRPAELSPRLAFSGLVYVVLRRARPVGHARLVAARRATAASSTARRAPHGPCRSWRGATPTSASTRSSRPSPTSPPAAPSWSSTTRTARTRATWSSPPRRPPPRSSPS